MHVPLLHARTEPSDTASRSKDITRRCLAPLLLSFVTSLLLAAAVHAQTLGWPLPQQAAIGAPQVHVDFSSAGIPDGTRYPIFQGTVDPASGATFNAPSSGTVSTVRLQVALPEAGSKIQAIHIRPATAANLFTVMDESATVAVAHGLNEIHNLNFKVKENDQIAIAFHKGFKGWALALGSGSGITKDQPWMGVDSQFGGIYSVGNTLVFFPIYTVSAVPYKEPVRLAYNFDFESDSAEEQPVQDQKTASTPANPRSDSTQLQKLLREGLTISHVLVRPSRVKAVSKMRKGKRRCRTKSSATHLFVSQEKTELPSWRGKGCKRGGRLLTTINYKADRIILKIKKRLKRRKNRKRRYKTVGYLNVRNLREGKNTLYWDGWVQKSVRSKRWRRLARGSYRLEATVDVTVEGRKFKSRKRSASFSIRR